MNERDRIWFAVAVICIATAALAGYIACEVRQSSGYSSGYSKGYLEGYNDGFSNSCVFTNAGLSDIVCNQPDNAPQAFNLTLSDDAVITNESIPIYAQNVSHPMLYYGDGIYYVKSTAFNIYRGYSLDGINYSTCKEIDKDNPDLVLRMWCSGDTTQILPENVTITHVEWRFP